MSPETRSTLATAFAVLAVLAAIAAGTVSALSAANLAHQIQTQRHEFVLENCLKGNQINRDTIRTLNRVVTKAAKTATPQRAAQIKASVASTTLLIDALAPKHDDCAAYAATVVHH